THARTHARSYSHSGGYCHSFIDTNPGSNCKPHVLANGGSRGGPSANRAAGWRRRASASCLHRPLVGARPGRSRHT
ncbi:MAG: hypothetical protein V3S01_08780, partial [Dehalococcoidia bacterium]